MLYKSDSTNQIACAVCCAAGEPSYASLVDSFKAVCEAAEKGDKVLDVEQLVHEPGALKEALAISKDSVIEWMEVQESLVAKEKVPDFVFRVKEATKVP